MPVPIRHPRALFIAAFCAASVASLRPSPAPVPTIVHRFQRINRDRALKLIVETVGAGIVAAGRARASFLERGAYYAPPKPKVAKIDPRLRVLIDALAEFEAGTDSSGECWVEAAASDPPRLYVFWRGLRIVGDRRARVFKTDKATGLERVAKGEGHIVGSVRELDAERFTAGLERAQAALDAAGFRTAMLPVNVSRIKLPKIDGERDSIEGLIGTIRLARARPLWMQQLPSRGGALVR